MLCLVIEVERFLKFKRHELPDYNNCTIILKKSNMAEYFYKKFLFHIATLCND